MRLHQFVLLGYLLLGTYSLHAGIYGTASVDASAFGGTSCSESESGSSGSVSCGASYQLPNGGFEQSYASASFSSALVAEFPSGEVENGLIASIFVNDGPNYYASASASVNVNITDWFIIYGGSGPGTLNANYSYESTSGGDFGSDPFCFSLEGGCYNSTGPMSTATQTMPFTYGVPFEINLTLSDYATTPGETQAQFTYYGVSFTDQDGNVLTAIPVPEPRTACLLVSAFLATAAARLRKKFILRILR